LAARTSARDFPERGWRAAPLNGEAAVSSLSPLLAERAEERRPFTLDSSAVSLREEGGGAGNVSAESSADAAPDRRNRKQRRNFEVRDPNLKFQARNGGLLSPALSSRGREGEDKGHNGDDGTK